MQKLAENGWLSPLNEAVMEQGKPFLGVCLGMQMLGRRSEEGSLPGLGWMDAETCKMPDCVEPTGKPLRFPHMGWNSVEVTRPNPLLALDDSVQRFYFVHSYHLKCHDPDNVVGQTSYGVRFCSVVQKGHIFGTQFHPEKSHRYGFNLLSNFARFA